MRARGLEGAKGEDSKIGVDGRTWGHEDAKGERPRGHEDVGTRGREDTRTLKPVRIQGSFYLVLKSISTCVHMSIKRRILLYRRYYVAPIDVQIS